MSLKESIFMAVFSSVDVTEVIETCYTPWWFFFREFKRICSSQYNRKITLHFHTAMIEECVGIRRSDVGCSLCIILTFSSNDTLAKDRRKVFDWSPSLFHKHTNTRTHTRSREFIVSKCPAHSSTSWQCQWWGVRSSSPPSCRVHRRGTSFSKFY